MLRELLRGSRPADNRGQIGGNLDLMAIMITVIGAGVTGYVGLNVMSTTRQQTAYNTTDDQIGTFEYAQTNLTDGITSFFGGLGTVFTVIILVVILSYLMLLRGR